jgi:CPA1 family monovalent cation:H+ antiporter
VALSDLVAVLLVLAALFSYLNYRLLRLPSTVGLTALTLLASLAAVAAGVVCPALARRAAAFVGHIDFNQAVLQGMLGFLLFAGALRVDLGELARQKVAVTALATVGVTLSTLLVGGLTWGLWAVVGVPVSPVSCWLFGALISPTDPIAVLALLKRLGSPKPLEVTVAGESLFNDGVGVVLFLALREVALEGHGFEPGHLTVLFLRQAVGGAAFGLAAGYVAYRLLKSVDNYQVEILLSLALVAGGYALADALHLSGPIAMVVAGLLIGNHGRLFAMSPTTVKHLDLFWELIDEVLTAVLFVLLGLGVLAVPFTPPYLAAGLLAIPVVLLARLVSVGLPVGLLRRWQPVERGAVRVLTWGGLRGALSVAMALALPREVGGAGGSEREVILVVTYVVVVFSILVQGLTLGPWARRWLAPAERPGGKESPAGRVSGTSPLKGAGRGPLPSG